MIQRIQTLFLLLATAAASMVFLFPIATYKVGMLNVVFTLVNKPGITDMSLHETIPMWPLYNTLLMSTLILLVLLCVFAIFLFRKRRLQLKLVMIGVLINMLIIIGIFMLGDWLEGKLTNTISKYEFGAFLPIASLVFLMLAFRGIKRDEKLVRSADRLR